MLVRELSDPKLSYYLVVLDEQCKERADDQGRKASDLVIFRLLEAPPVTDVFIASHGWKGDVPSAIQQYDSWFGMMARAEADLAEARRLISGFNPLVIGVHWPSLPWGDESMPAAVAPGVLGVDDLDAGLNADIDAYAARIADTSRAREAIRTILVAARQTGATGLTPEARDAYATLFAESGLGADGPAGAPGRDGAAFDPEAIVAQARGDQDPASARQGLLGWGDDLKDALLSPLRQLSFWKMKDRARRIGEEAVHGLLRRLMIAAPHARFHLMGHSFGCIVMSAAVAGAPGAEALPRPVDSLFLVQGALSIWSYAAQIPYPPNPEGYFNRILAENRVGGPVVTTRSRHDKAVGTFYPLGAGVAGQMLLGAELPPAYAGVGAYGLQGVDASDRPMETAAAAYGFVGGRIYNLEASDIIKNGAGASGAHSDIVHPEVAHAFWQAALAGVQKKYPSPARGGGGLLSDGDYSAYFQRSIGGQEADVEAAIAPEGIFLDEVSGEPRAAVPEPAPPPGGERRWINAEIVDHPKDKALAVGVNYKIAFDIDLMRHALAVGHGVFEGEQAFADGEAEAILTVQLGGVDFHIPHLTAALILPRAGKSRNTAVFDIVPLHEGESRLVASIYKQGNFIQRMELTFDIGAAQPKPVQVSSIGRAPSSAFHLRPRQLSITLSPATGGYECSVYSQATSMRAHLPLLPAYLDGVVKEARDALMEVVNRRDAKGELVFQAATGLSPADKAAALKIMARAGATLFQQLFFAANAGADSQEVGKFLAMMAGGDQILKVQIVGDGVPIPWQLLYFGEVSAGADLDWDHFLGIRHIVEVIPFRTHAVVYDSRIPSEPPLVVSINVNDGIDAQFGLDLVGRQRAFWTDMAARHNLTLSPRATSADVVGAFANANTKDQIAYFYCHAKSNDLSAQGGPDTSCLIFTDARVTLRDFKLDAPPPYVAPPAKGAALPGNPLVFVNACESAEMSPIFYDGFVPYFLSKGARGVIGTECPTPGIFAAQWAERFFKRFFAGETVGDAFLHLRKEFLDTFNNPLGLLYAVHCDGDTQIDPALEPAS